MQTLVFLLVAGGVLFGSAGRWDLPYFWALLGVWTLLASMGLFTVDPGLQKERMSEFRSGGRDLLPMLLIVPPSLMGQWVIAGLDAGRYHWSDDVPFGVHMAGLLGSVVAALGGWAMTVNPFFVETVRIQPERGHRLITSGPYRYVRHPGYLGAMVGFLSTSLALGSWWSLVPIAPAIIMILRRTALEDRFLRAELEGYAGYAGRVRYRLLPGVW